ncbi:MAG: ribosome biogenesis GTP-binding protein YihA/YsxC, partial [Candidatus Margulisbacteria bacterium]|nr:ribosome biogenesis GTP-binding protein YihA/YsxC [Candidatus Margulisiibacteriota bacterium]
MKITSADFIKGLVGPDALLEDGTPQIALIGRSNVGKSSVINTLANRKALARTSAYPGRTKEINVFFLNRSVYLLDLPGYGFAKASWAVRRQLLDLIDWYLYQSPYEQKAVFLIIDAKVGPTEGDRAMLQGLEEHKKKIVIVANKTDKIKRSEYGARLAEIRAMVGKHKLIPFSSEDKTGLSDL